MQALAPELVWGLLPRMVGVLYVLAFGAFIPQILMVGGSRGTLPVRELYARVRKDYPGLRRFADYPSLLWLSQSDGFLRVLPWLGVACGLCAIYGGTLGFAGLVLGWMLWLSLEPFGLVFPWDTLLQEVGFLVLFLPATEPLPELTASALPLPTVAFMCRWLVLRVVLGFGKDKFLGVNRRDALYLRGFFVWMPLPTPLGWLGHHAPAWLLKLSLAFMFFAEMIAPVLGLWSGLPRLISCAALVALMAGIQATGNWGYFNIAYILLCIVLLDSQSSIFDLASAPFADRLWQWPDVGVHALMATMFVVSLVYLPLNSWNTRSWVNWPPNLFAMRRTWWTFSFRLHRVLAPLRAIAPLRLVNGYGVFPPHSSPPQRMIPVFEGSDDGVTWKQYGYRFMPSFAEQRPPVIAPYHARNDQACYYVCNSISSASLFGSITPYGNPFLAYAHASWPDLVAQRLLRADPLHLAGFSHNPFPDAPPKQVRVAIVAMTPTRPRELLETGRWWHVQRLGTFIPARGLESWPDRLVMPPPELMHPDLVAFKRRSLALRKVSDAFEAGASAADAAIAGSDLVAEDVAQFWSELVPALAAERGDFARLHERADALRARFSVDDLYRLERVFERLAWLLRLRTQRLLAQPTAPGPELVSSFRYHMQLHELVLDGPDAYASYLAEPARAAERVARTTDATQLWALALLRYPQFMSHVCSFRWSELGLRAREQGMPGIFEYYELMVELVPRDEQFRPRPIQHGDGEYTIEGFYPPPRLTS